MKKQILIYLSISILNLGLFLGVFTLLQNEKVYEKTLGRVSYNYERVGKWNSFKINNVKKPYTDITNHNLLWWDAPIYQCISERMYTKEEACYGKVRAAFFPLFPIIWKVTDSSAISISIINYFLFSAGLALLCLYFYNNSLFESSSVFALMLTFPTTIIFFIPYTEALFFFCMALTAIGLLKSNYPLYFIGALLTAMVRPAAVFILLAILTAELFIGLRHKNAKLYIKDSFLSGLPFGIGYSIAILIQFWTSGSWSALRDSHAYWSGGIQKIESIVDWSIEGFGMNVFSIIVVSIPAFVFCLYVALSLFAKSSVFLNTLKDNKTNYIFLVSMLYIAGILCFTLLTSGGNLHSYFRFTLSTPLFYLGALILLGFISKTRTRYHLLIFCTACVLLFLFMNNVPYGGSRITFSYVGMYLLILTTGFLLIRKYLNNAVQIAFTGGIIIANTIWTTYLLNAYLSNGWLFT